MQSPAEKIFKNKQNERVDKSIAALKAVQNTPHYTRTTIRVKFPDLNYLQGTFGAKETCANLYEFVR